MPDQPALLRAFADYAHTIARPYEIGEVLYRLTDQLTEVLEVDGAGVSIAESDGRALGFVTATDEQVTKVEEKQIELADGPCHDAYRHGRRITVNDLGSEERYPDYGETALKQGFRAVAGVPLMVGDQQPMGALNLYREAAGAWPADELEIAQVLADMATGYIVNARTLSAQRELTTQLQHALDSRVIIEQAKGLLAGRHEIETAAAFQALRSHARSNNAKLHDVARAVVDGELKL